MQYIQDFSESFLLIYSSIKPIQEFGGSSHSHVSHHNDIYYTIECMYTLQHDFYLNADNIVFKQQVEEIVIA